MTCYRFENHQPIVSASAYIHPTAVIIGHVIIGDGCYIGPGASLRGDFGHIRIEHDANVQDNCVLHGTIDSETIIRARGHIGHGAVVHGCLVEEDVLIGMNAVVMDNSVIGARSIIGSCAMVRAGFSCPAESLVMGVPAKVHKTLSQREIDKKREATQRYMALAKRSLAALVPC
ncbi:gamma carbonic anhydrase family protein [Halomonas sp. C22]|jgi:carbonic anhydrase/acetyltransferase-like protein (isoleucine patch superfamily)|uniref:gamma carbonic anhydrase family protein n=1 Tax=Halomonas sp. C22 TaxID=2580567 RepID=UPI00119E657D|nr:phenylacetic acid degradation protein PaaY [Halomonas sp. C22]